MAPPEQSAEAVPVQWIRDELNKKANKEWVEAIISGVKSSADESKKISLSAKKEASAEHECYQAELIGKIMAEVMGWTKWFRIILISALVGLAGLGGTALWKFWQLQSAVGEAQGSVSRVEGSMTQIQKNQDEVSSSIQRDADERARSSKEQMEQLRLLIGEAVRQAMSEGKASRVVEPLPVSQPEPVARN
jgi:hypothetical protein